MSNSSKRPPLLILALDAGDPEFIDRWVRQGFLPTIATLFQRGCWGRVTGPEMVSPDFGIWLSVLSGIPLRNHGYYYFRQLIPGTYDLRLFSHLNTGVLPFWSHLRGSTHKVAIFDPPESPLVPGMDGIQLGGWGTRHIPQVTVPATADPPGLWKEARHVFGRPTRIGDLSRGNIPDDLHIRRRLLESVERKGRLIRHFLSRNQYDLTMIGLFEAHTAAHRFWEYTPDVGGIERRMQRTGLEESIRTVYQAIDNELEQLLKILPQETTIVLLSCYGMEGMYPTTDLFDGFCRQLGYQTRPLANSMVSHSNSPMDQVRRLLPQSWRTALSHRLPPGIQERLLADHFRNSTDWGTTRAFSIPSLYTSFVRVNLRGREPTGLIDQGAEYEKLLDDVEHDLAQLIDPHTGEPAVLRIDRTTRTHGGGIPRMLPDLFVRWRPVQHFMNRLIHPRAELVQEKPGYFRGSTHSDQGVFIAAGPLIGAHGSIGTVAPINLAPTFFELLGRPVPSELAGQSIAALLQNGTGV